MLHRSRTLCRTRITSRVQTKLCIIDDSPETCNCCAADKNKETIPASHCAAPPCTLPRCVPTRLFDIESDPRDVSTSVPIKYRSFMFPRLHHRGISSDLYQAFVPPHRDAKAQDAPPITFSLIHLNTFYKCV